MLPESCSQREANSYKLSPSSIYTVALSYKFVPSCSSYVHIHAWVCFNEVLVTSFLCFFLSFFVLLYLNIILNTAYTVFTFLNYIHFIVACILHIVTIHNTIHNYFCRITIRKNTICIVDILFACCIFLFSSFICIILKYYFKNTI